MSRLAENLIEIYSKVSQDNDIWRLLYYQTDPLDETKDNVQDLPDFHSVISKERMIRSPKTDDFSTDPLCRICMYFGNGNLMNRSMSEQDVVFDVYVHIDHYDRNDARSLWIIDRLLHLLNDTHVTGIGRMIPKARYIIPNSPSGYIGYKIVFSFGSVQ